MLYKEEIELPSGNQVKFYFTQGDTVSLLAIPQNESGELIDLSLIQSCTFKLANKKEKNEIGNFKLVFKKEVKEKNENGFLIKLEDEETSTFPVSRDLCYSIEYLFYDGTVNTPNFCDIEVWPRIV
ncbi:MAG: hypothetical protein ACI4R8_01105 [Candidatus Caccovivens sp.]